VTTDLFPELVSYLRSGVVSASLYQRPFTQGRLAMEAVANHLLRRTPAPRNTRLAPHIVLRSNLSLFLEPSGTSLEAPDTR
jgi:LacI family transcriptional regulator